MVVVQCNALDLDELKAASLSLAHACLLGQAF